MDYNHLQFCPNPIFIIGSPRSGTTALAWSLAQHNQLWTSSESFILFDLFGAGRVDRAFQKAKDNPSGSWFKSESVEKAEFLEFMGLGLNALFTSRSQGRRWIDQTPYYAYLSDTLAHMFPGALFLHILRDGRRVVNSMINFAQALTDDARKGFISSGRLPPWATDFRIACKEWHNSVEVSMEFCAKNPTRSLTVLNEELVANPEKKFHEIFRFFGVSYEEGPISYFQSHRINSSFPQEDLSKPPSIDRHSNPWNGWTEEQKMIFVEEAADTLLKYGLVTEDDRKLLEYYKLIHQIRKIVADILPADGTVMVISKGDDRLVKLNGRQVWHFPRAEEGWYAGYYPADSSEAISHLEMLHNKGGDFLLFPSTAFWWLDYYREFQLYLETRYCQTWSSESCIIYKLSDTSVGG